MKANLCVLMLTVSFAALAQEKGGAPLPPPGHVSLPLDEYNKLVELAAKRPKKPEAPPLPYTIQRAEMKLEVSTDSAKTAIQLEGEVLNKGVTKVPLVTGMTILNAQQKGKDLPLQQESGTHTAVLAGPAEFSIALDAALPLRVDAGRASVTIPAPSAGAVHLTAVIPGDHTNVSLNPGLITSRTSGGGRTTVEATLFPGQPASIWWATRGRVAPPAPREARFLSVVKTVVSVREADLAINALVTATVIQGDPSQFEVAIPAGYEITGVTGFDVESSEVQSGVLLLKVDEKRREHLFLISLEKPVSAFEADVSLVSVKGAQRETGETLIEGEGTIELTATERGSMKRMDVREADPSFRSSARFPIQAAFRYHKQPAETPGLALKWVRFPNGNVLAAIAQRAIVTTMVTSEGKSLSEVRLVLRNQAQPFLKVALPSGASILSADVAGEKVKPVLGADGNRVPLLRAGFRPTGAYAVSFVFMHSGAPFARKGGSELSLPKMDIPIALLQWEVFLPERYKVWDFGGDIIATRLMPTESEEVASADELKAAGGDEAWAIVGEVNVDSLVPGQLGGFVVDPQGSPVPRAHIAVVHTSSDTSRTARTDQAGRWVVSDLPSGRLRIAASAPGYRQVVRELDYSANRPERLSLPLEVGAVASSIEVQAPNARAESRRIERELSNNQQKAVNTASSNVVNLQRRVSGVLPIAVEVPRAGNSFRFVRPLVIDEETKVTFTYKTNK